MRCEQHAGRLDYDCGRCLRVRRSDAWAQWIARQADWNLFGGLTFDPRRRVPPPPGPQRGEQRLRPGPRLTEDGSVRLGGRPLAPDVARRRVWRFFRDSQDLLGRQLAGVVALEFHKNGWPHFHPLIAVEGGLQGGEVAALGGLWFAHSGGNRLEQPRSLADVSAYAAKYLTKGLDDGDLLLWPRSGGFTSAWRLSFGRSPRGAA